MLLRFLLVASVLATMTPARADDQLYLGSLKPEFFVVSNGDKSTVVTMGVAQEIEKQSLDVLGPNAPWIIPEPSWSTADEIAARCAHDPNALGGIVIIYYHGYATHFFLLWQSETTTLDVSASVISCNRTADNHVAPTLVGMIGPLPNAQHTPWVVKRTQISIPLLTIAGYASTITKNNNAAVLATILAATSSRDIPGYSDPDRLRAIAQHLGVDVVDGLQAVCATTNDVPAGVSIAPRTKLCGSLGLR